MQRSKFLQVCLVFSLVFSYLGPLCPLMDIAQAQEISNQESVNQEIQALAEVERQELVLPLPEPLPEKAEVIKDDLPIIDNEIETIVGDSQEITDESLLLTQDDPPLYTQKDEIPSVTGKLNINTDVSSGALIHSYPIDIPSGRNGLQSDLQLIYNNQDQSNKNIFGYGWSIDIPYIERIAREGVDKLYTTNYFNSSLTGELVETNISNIYASKVDGGEFFDYQYDSVNNLWVVKDKLGKIYTFGSTASSRQDNPNDSIKVYKWMLEEVRDTNDNFIRYEYYKDSGQIYPANIFYTGYDDTDGIFKVEFLREFRNDNVDNLETGFLVNTNYRISTIEISINNQWESRYSLDYITGDNGSHSLLNSITKSGRDASGNAVSLPSEEFSYESKSTGWTLDTNYSIPTSFINGFEHDLGARIADVNGDGLVDILVSNFPYGEGYKAVFVNDGDGTGWTEDTNYTIPMYFSNGNGTDYGVRLVDVNGDGFTDLLTAGGVFINDGDGTGWTQDTNYTVPCSFISEDGLKDKGCRIADVNGDGLVDILYKQLSGEDEGAYINDGDGTGWTQDTNYSIPVSFVDTWEVDTGVVISDINGDGLADILVSNNNPSPGYKAVFINDGDGTGWTEDTNYIIPTYFSSGHGADYGVRLVDVNGDNFTDILVANNGAHTVYINDADGTGWTNNASYIVPCTFIDLSVYGNKDGGCRIADVNGDDLIDMLYTPIGVAGAVYISNPDKSDLLSEIKYSTGAITNIDYKSSAEYVDGSNNILNPDLPLSVQAVERITIDDGLDHQSIINYEYSDGQFYYNNPYDKKFASFGKITRIEDNRKTISYYHQGNTSNSSQGEYNDSYYKIGKKYRQEVYDKNTNDLLRQEIYKWEEYDLGNDNSFVYNTLKSNTDFDNSTKSTAIQYQYSTSTGNLLVENNLGEAVVNTDTGEINDQLVGDEKDTNYEYAQNIQEHILVAPKTKVISDSVDSKQQNLYYDDLPLGEIEKVNLTKEDYIDQDVEINRHFDSYGLVYQEISPKGATTTLAYDNSHLYPTSSTNALNQTTYIEYNLLNGQVATSTAPNGLVTANQYDAFGRLKEVWYSNPASPSTLIKKQEINYQDTNLPRYKD